MINCTQSRGIERLVCAQEDEQRAFASAFSAPGAADAVENIFKRLRERACSGPGGAISWQASREAPASGFAPLGPHLYDGFTGVALFLGLYYSVTAEAEARDLAWRSIAPLKDKIARLAADPERTRSLALALGGLVGLGSFLYTFVRLAAWLREPALFEAAQAAASLITPERILADRRFDVTDGCAGTLLALLALNTETALESAILCGQHLLDQRVSAGSRPRAWAGLSGPPLPGFAHGASGIAYALTRLFERTGRGEFRDAAIEAFRFERSLYDADSRTWLNLRFNRPLEQSAWCQGAPGMALARLGCLGSLGCSIDTPEIREDLEETLDITRKLPEVRRDHLCCGNFGRVDILQTAGRILGRPELVSEAEDLARRALEQSSAGDFRLRHSNEPRSSQEEPVFQPSLFLGLAGIGYALMRLMYPGRVPCILLFE